MDTSRLLASLDHILNGIRDTETLANLQRLNQSASQLLAAPSKADYTKSFESSLESFFRSLSNLESRQTPAGSEFALRTVQADLLMPDLLRHRVESIVQRTGPSLASVSSDLQALLAEISALIDKLTTARDAIKSLGLEAHSLPNNECEIGVFIPSTVTKDDLDQIQDQLSSWNRVFKNISEITHGKVIPVRMTGTESGSFDFHIAMDMEGAKAFLLVLGGVVSIFQLRQKYSTKRRELEEDGFPPSVTEALKNEERNIHEQRIAHTIEQTITIAHESLEPSRIHELKTSIKIDVEFVASSLNSGVKIEVLPPPSSTNADSANDSQEPSPAHQIARLAIGIDSSLRRIERGVVVQPELMSSADLPHM